MIYCNHHRLVHLLGLVGHLPLNICIYQRSLGCQWLVEMQSKSDNGWHSPKWDLHITLLPKLRIIAEEGVPEKLFDCNETLLPGSNRAVAYANSWCLWYSIKNDKCQYRVKICFCHKIPHLTGYLLVINNSQERKNIIFIFQIKI